MNTQSIRILVVDANTSYRQAIIAFLNLQSELECIQDVSTGDSAVRALKDGSIEEPDIILLGLDLPGTHGLDTIPRLSSLSPESKITVLTQSKQEIHLLQAIARGVSGYLLKTSTHEEIYNNLIKIWNGEPCIDPTLTHLIMKLIRKSLPPDDSSELQLTSRETEVLQLLSEGYVKKEIAAELYVSSHGIDKRMRRIYNKLEVQNSASAVAKALRHGLI